jgi:tRNA nucleotidyltransferase (CCA-adding enzyme)
MNAIALDNNGDVVDPFDGCADIYSRIVRAVGSPEDRFNEDALRIMRAIRFAAVFDFEVDGETKAAIFKLYPKLEAVSKERINAELLKIANSKHFFSSLAEYAEVFAFIMGIDSFNIKQSLDSEDYITKLAYMFLSVSDAEQVMNDLKFDGDTRDKVIELVKWKPYHLSQIDRVELKIWLNRIGAEQLYRLGKIHGYDLTSAINNLKDECYTIKDLAVNGNDIMALGYKGKDVGTVLTETLKAVIEETIPNDKTEIIKFIQGLNIQ